MAADSATRVTCFTCKCLNVKIKASKPVDAIHPELALEPGSVPVYVKQDGISVAHPQLTLRIRSKATPYDGQARSAQFMSLACLICRTLVYRVHQVVSSKLAAPEGPVIPKAGWVETEVLRTPSGWIEVFEDALADPDVTRQESSPRYSTLFSLVLPPLVTELQPLSLEPSVKEPSSPSTVRYLDNMEPLFADMSNSSDLVFQHLSSIALQQSQTLRQRAEQEVDDIIKSKIAQVAHVERELKLQVQTLLQAYRDGLRIIEEEGKPVPPTPKPWKDASTSSDVRAANSINEFIPSAVPPRRHSPETRKVSTLSASLVTSSFHHPKAVQDDTGSRPSSLTSYSDNRASSHGGSLLDFKRINNEDLNTATTYRYFVIEEEMERVNAAKQPAVNAKPDAKTKDASQTPSTPPKPKRKVTFDLQPTSSDDAKVEERAAPNEGEMVFDLEDERGDDSERAADPALVLPFVEQSPNRMKSHRQPDAAGSLLVSSSLSKEPIISNGPSPLRVLSSSPEQNTTVLPTSTGQRKAHSRGPSFEVPDAPSLPEQNGISIEGRLQDEYDEEIKKVLAAGTPSHRAAWKNGGKAWGQFLHRGRERIFDSDKLAGDASDDEDGDELYELEEEEDEVNESAQANGIPGSMPIRIRSFGKKQEVLSLASFRDRPQTLKATANGT